MGYPKVDPKIGNGLDFKADRELRKDLSDILADCRKRGKLRQQICDELSVRLGQNITKYMLNDWTSTAKKPARFPACFIEAFSEVTNDDRLQRHIMGTRLHGIVELGTRVTELRSLATAVAEQANALAEQAPQKKRAGRHAIRSSTR